MLQPKEWILKKNLSNKEYEAVRVGDVEYRIDRETEKAIRFEIVTDFGSIFCWCPKSQTVEVEEAEAINEQELADRIELLANQYKLDVKDFNNYSLLHDAAMTGDTSKLEEKANKMNGGLAYNQMLKEFAKANGIKGIRQRMATATLIAKIEQAGLEVPARA